MQAPLPTPVATSQQQPQQPQMSREMIITALKNLMMQLDCSPEEYGDKFQSVSLHACLHVLFDDHACMHACSKVCHIPALHKEGIVVKA